MSRALRAVPNVDGNVGVLTPAAAARFDRTPLIVHSHLRWDFVWQRPQQILSRLADRHPILFLEEPIDAASQPSLQITVTSEGIVRVVPALPGAGSLTTDARSAIILPLLESALKTHPALAGRFDAPIQWFYSPMTAPSYCGRFGAIGTVYDCMDELANFRFAPADIAQRENFLISHADIIFTGGYEIYRAKSSRHGNTHFFGCGVDAAHFAAARAPDTVVPPELAALPRPVLGYFGVIDERLDLELVAHLAREFPNGSVAMVGPLAKIRRDELPVAANIHWLGQRSYSELPSLVKGFDVCLMPFAMNAATQYINPTKTLEYLAAGKRVVSTPVPDVVRQFADVVDIADSCASFASKVGMLLDDPSPERVAAGIERARASSWDATVQAMRELMLQSVARKRAKERSRPLAVAASRSTAGMMAGDGPMRDHVASIGMLPAGAAAND